MWSLWHCAPVEELRLSLAPGRLFAQFHQCKVLQHAACKSRVHLQSLRGQPQQMREQAGVIQINLRGLNDALAQVARPRSQQLHEKGCCTSSRVAGTFKPAMNPLGSPFAAAK